MIPSNDEIFFFSEERLKNEIVIDKNSDLDVKENLKEPIKKKLPPCEGNKERSLDVPSQKLNSRLKNKTRSSDSLSESKKCTEDHHQPQQQDNANDKKNKFTWCGSCKNAKSGKRTLSTSPLKKQSRSSLTTDSIVDNTNSKITLNLSKYSPCASRLANQASPKSLKNDLSPLGGTSPESPLHVGRAISPLSLNVQRLQRPPRSKSASGGTSPKSDSVCLTCSTEILAADDDDKTSPRATAPASAIELSLDGARRSSNFRSRR